MPSRGGRGQHHNQNASRPNTRWDARPSPEDHRDNDQNRNTPDQHSYHGGNRGGQGYSSHGNNRGNRHSPPNHQNGRNRHSPPNNKSGRNSHSPPNHPNGRNRQSPPEHHSRGNRHSPSGPHNRGNRRSPPNHHNHGNRHSPPNHDNRSVSHSPPNHYNGGNRQVPSGNVADQNSQELPDYASDTDESFHLNRDGPVSQLAGNDRDERPQPSFDDFIAGMDERESPDTHAQTNRQRAAEVEIGSSRQTPSSNVAGSSRSVPVDSGSRSPYRRQRDSPQGQRPGNVDPRIDGRQQQHNVSPPTQPARGSLAQDLDRSRSPLRPHEDTVHYQGKGKERAVDGTRYVRFEDDVESTRSESDVDVIMEDAPEAENLVRAIDFWTGQSELIRVEMTPAIPRSSDDPPPPSPIVIRASPPVPQPSRSVTQPHPPVIRPSPPVSQQTPPVVRPPPPVAQPAPSLVSQSATPQAPRPVASSAALSNLVSSAQPGRPPNGPPNGPLDGPSSRGPNEPSGRPTRSSRKKLFFVLPPDKQVPDHEGFIGPAVTTIRTQPPYSPFSCSFFFLSTLCRIQTSKSPSPEIHEKRSSPWLRLKRKIGPIPDLDPDSRPPKRHQNAVRPVPGLTREPPSVRTQAQPRIPSLWRHQREQVFKSRSARLRRLRRQSARRPLAPRPLLPSFTFGLEFHDQPSALPFDNPRPAPPNVDSRPAPPTVDSRPSQPTLGGSTPHHGESATNPPSGETGNPDEEDLYSSSISSSPPPIPTQDSPRESRVPPDLIPSEVIIRDAQQEEAPISELDFALSAAFEAGVSIPRDRTPPRSRSPPRSRFPPRENRREGSENSLGELELFFSMAEEASVVQSIERAGASTEVVQSIERSGAASPEVFHQEEETIDELDFALSVAFEAGVSIPRDRTPARSRSPTRDYRRGGEESSLGELGLFFSMAEQVSGGPEVVQSIERTGASPEVVGTVEDTDEDSDVGVAEERRTASPEVVGSIERGDGSRREVDDYHEDGYSTGRETESPEGVSFGGRTAGNSEVVTSVERASGDQDVVRSIEHATGHPDVVPSIERASADQEIVRSIERAPGYPDVVPTVEGSPSSSDSSGGVKL